jgi:hypothetical protein
VPTPVGEAQADNVSNVTITSEKKGFFMFHSPVSFIRQTDGANRGIKVAMSL